MAPQVPGAGSTFQKHFEETQLIVDLQGTLMRGRVVCFPSVQHNLGASLEQESRFPRFSAPAAWIPSWWVTSAALSCRPPESPPSLLSLRTHPNASNPRMHSVGSANLCCCNEQPPHLRWVVLHPTYILLPPHMRTNTSSCCVCSAQCGFRDPGRGMLLPPGRERVCGALCTDSAHFGPQRRVHSSDILFAKSSHMSRRS